MKHILGRLLFIFIIYALCLTSCEDDRYLTQISEQDLLSNDLGIKANFIQRSSISQTNKDLDHFITERFENRIQQTEDQIHSNLYGFTIYTDRILQLESENYTSYIFPVLYPDQAVREYVENYMLTFFDNGSYMQVLINYPLIINEGIVEADVTQATITYIDDNTLLLGTEMSPCANTTEEIIEWSNETDCVYTNCTAGMQNTYGQTCYGTPEQQPQKICYGGWVVTGCISYGGSTTTSGSSTDPSNDTTSGGSSNNTNGNDDSNELIPTVPVFDLGLKNECDKVKNLFLNHPNHQQKIVNLNTKTNLNYESAVGIYDNNTEFEIQGAPNNYLVSLPQNPPAKYKSIAHVHNEFTSTTDTITTYSVFSVSDLQFMAQRMKEDELTDDFVAFLTTGKGTQYAITIHNRNKFRKFFKYLDYYQKASRGETLSTDEINYIENVIKPIYNKYFYRILPPSPIRAENTNNHQVLLAFLNFMKEADMGTTMFKANTNFDTFERLNINEHGTSFTKENCND
ncbi:hypothetical protein [Kordia jejudonensis]|uniref:hypothetical protein n=1 Tax=Kordia jejudonensis TaxID=1348245 RepID=UPI000629A07A|nr:hypothetical protein [Kordia jejudonensis]